jgi:endonuclease YncB( thermonuclease family)
MVGLLRVTGKIELAQFWPDGSADADTTKIKVIVSANSFEHAADGEHFKKTDALLDARVVGTQSGPIIDSKSRITVRLQGIDAPELHYRAAALRKSSSVSDAERKKFNALNKEERRQYLAESSTVALAAMLGKLGDDEIKCQMLSYVDRPTEVVDTYGRFVGNIRVAENYKTDVNLWLTEKGWVYPTFYSSMSREEIEELLKAMKKGRDESDRVWDNYSKDASKFDPHMVYRKNGEPDPDADLGPVLMPKLFRRQVAFRMQKGAGVISGSFNAYLKNNPDACFELEDFLEAGVHSATPRKLVEFMDGSQFELEPHEVVFKEKFSKLVDKNGKELMEF